MIAPTSATENWNAARLDLTLAQRELGKAPEGVARQLPFDRLLAAERRCTRIIHSWFAEVFQLEQVREPRLVLSLDVDGVLEDDAEGFTSASLAGASALKLLEVGQVAVLLNTARSLVEVRERVSQFRLLGGVGAFGASTWDELFGRETCLLSDRGAAELDSARAAVRAKANVLVDSGYDSSVRVSQLTDGRLRPVPGPDARKLLDRAGLKELTFWVAPRHTDFVDRNVDKGKGLQHLQQGLGLSSLPLAAMGDGACDVPMLKRAQIAFVPAATLPSYQAPRGQRLARLRSLGGQALWEAACQLVPNVALQRRVLAMGGALNIPEWMPASLRTPPSVSRSLFPRIASALMSKQAGN